MTPSQPQTAARCRRPPKKNARIRDERMDMTKQEVQAQELLRAAMQDEGIAEYEYDDIHVQMTTNMKVKVKKAKAADE